MAQRQFRSDDTSSWQSVAFGDGSDGAYAPSTETDAPVDSSCSGTSGTTSLSATNASFATDQAILIHQTRGTGVGTWELNKIASYTAGTITTSFSLTNTYTDSGASQAQVMVLKKYSSALIDTGVTITSKAWDGNVGGLYGFLCNGTTTITGSIVSSAKGHIGGAGAASQGQAGAGEGSAGATVAQQAANGNSGGGGQGDDSPGGGGGNGAVGGSGGGSSNQGQGGGTSGAASLVTMTHGGSGGGGSEFNAFAGPAGSKGGGMVLIISLDIAEITGTIPLTGATGGGADSCFSGGGAGGSCLLKAQTAVLGASKITAAGGAGQSGDGKTGGSGGVGRIHIDYKTSLEGSTTPTLDSTEDSTLYESSGAGGGSFLLNMI